MRAVTASPYFPFNTPGYRLFRGMKEVLRSKQGVALLGESSVTRADLRTTRIPLQVTLASANVPPFKIVLGSTN